MEPDAGEWKRLARARLASARAALLFSLLGLSRRRLETDVVSEGLTSTQALFVIASEDRARTAAIESTLGGEERCREPAASADGQFSDALAHLLAARAELLSAFARVPDGELFSSGRCAPSSAWIDECVDHDQTAADRLDEWRARRSEPEGDEPRELLIAAIRAARKELLTEIALIPEEQRASWPVAGRAQAETLTEALVYTARREWAMEQNAWWAMGHAAAQEPAWPTAWDDAWRQLHDIHHRLIRRLEELPEDTLNRPAGGPTGTAHRPYAFYRMQAASDRHLSRRLHASRRTTLP